MEQIGRHVYNNLKNKKDLTEEEVKKIKQYEQVKKELSPEQKKAVSEYNKKICEPRKSRNMTIDKNKFWSFFKFQYECMFGEFIETPETIKNVKTIILYFLKDEEFFKCENLSTHSKPSFDKGLLIIGGYGNGKSSIMQAVGRCLCYSNESFAFKNTNTLVMEFEGLREAEYRNQFWRSITTGRILFDDAMTERDASNFGKVNILKDVIEKRYLQKSKTHITCNYPEENPTIDGTLEEIGRRYGSRVHDRLFEMFNIIEFKGKSMRK